MKAAVMRAFNAPLEIEDLSIDALGPGEVLVKTAASGVCQSDLHVIDVRPGDHVIGCLTTFSASTCRSASTSTSTAGCVAARPRAK